MAGDGALNNDLKPYLRDFAVFSQTPLFKFLCDKRKDVTYKQIDGLIQAAIVSTDPRVRAIGTAIVKDGALWSLFADLKDAMSEREDAQPMADDKKQIRDYQVPEFASDFMPSYTP